MQPIYPRLLDRICIVEPNTYEIVEVITVSGQTAVREDRGGHAKLVLTDEERMIILREVDMSDGSTRPRTVSPSSTPRHQGAAGR